MAEVLVPFIVFSSIFGTVAIFLFTRNKERMALIEKGQSADLFKDSSSHINWTLKIGILMVGVGLGIMVGYFVSAYTPIETRVAFPSMTFLFAGLALVVSSVIDRNGKK